MRFESVPDCETSIIAAATAGGMSASIKLLLGVSVVRNGQFQLRRHSVKFGKRALALAGAFLQSSLSGRGVGLQLMFCNGAEEGLTAAFYAVLELSIPLRKLSNYIVWTRRSLARRIALAETHNIPGDESMAGTFVFVQLSVLPRCGRHLDNTKIITNCVEAESRCPNSPSFSDTKLKDPRLASGLLSS